MMLKAFATQCRWIAARPQPVKVLLKARSAFACSAYEQSSERYSIHDLSVGQEIQGTVKTIVPFGAFIDVGATTDGLIHISQLTDSFVRDVNDVVQVGENVNVRVLSIEGNNRLALTMKSGDGEQQDRRGGGGYAEPRDDRRSGYNQRNNDRERW